MRDQTLLPFNMCHFFMCDKWRHLALCLHMMEPQFSLCQTTVSYWTAPTPISSTCGDYTTWGVVTMYPMRAVFNTNEICFVWLLKTIINLPITPQAINFDQQLIVARSRFAAKLQKLIFDNQRLKSWLISFIQKCLSKICWRIHFIFNIWLFTFHDIELPG